MVPLSQPLPFSVITGPAVRRILASSRAEVVDVVRAAYLLHHDGQTVNPPSQFLRFADKPSARVIGLPAYVGGDYQVAGMKWIASFPANIEKNLPRASAVLMLNDDTTGYPFACLEASQISAARTAASAVLGAEQLAADRAVGAGGRVAFVGCGIIARTILEYMMARAWPIDELVLSDLATPYAAAFADLAAERYGLEARVAPNPTEAIAAADVAVLATTTSTPHLNDALSANQIVLHISLRDLDPAVIATASNIVDDVDHCLTAATSLHLAEQALSTRDFVTATLAQLIRGEVTLPTDRPRIFSPFGLGVLDLAVGMHVYRRATATGDVEAIADFFAETTRWN